MGMAPIMPEAGYFMIVNAAAFKDALRDTIGNGTESWDIKCKTTKMDTRNIKLYNSCSLDDIGGESGGDPDVAIYFNESKNKKRFLFAFLLCEDKRRD